MFCIFIFSFDSFIWSQTLCFVSFRHHYHPQRSWGKVIFSVACVKNSVHRGVCRIACWNPPWDQRQTPWDQRQTLPEQEADPMVPEADPSWEQTPPGAVHAGRYGQRAGGTHPTGMQTCQQIEWGGVNKRLSGGAVSSFVNSQHNSMSNLLCTGLICIITNFCGHLPYYHQRIAPIVSQIVVVLLNRELSDGSVK